MKNLGAGVVVWFLETTLAFAISGMVACMWQAVKTDKALWFGVALVILMLMCALLVAVFIGAGRDLLAGDALREAGEDEQPGTGTREKA